MEKHGLVLLLYAGYTTNQSCNISRRKNKINSNIQEYDVCYVTITEKVTASSIWDNIRRNKLEHLAEAEGTSTEILCSDKLCINFFWKSFTGFIVLCNAQESIPVTAKQQINWSLETRDSSYSQMRWTHHTCDSTSSPWTGRVTLRHPIQLPGYQQQSLHLV